MAILPDRPEVFEEGQEAPREGKPHRITTRIPAELHAQVRYWAQKGGLSESEFVQESIEFMIRWKNKDYDLPTLEIQRLNQLVEHIKILSSNVHGLEGVVTNGFDSLLKLTRGDNYLLEALDAEYDD